MIKMASLVTESGNFYMTPIVPTQLSHSIASINRPSSRERNKNDGIRDSGVNQGSENECVISAYCSLPEINMSAYINNKYLSYCLYRIISLQSLNCNGDGRGGTSGTVCPF